MRLRFLEVVSDCILLLIGIFPSFNSKAMSEGYHACRYSLLYTFLTILPLSFGLATLCFEKDSFKFSCVVKFKQSSLMWYSVK